MTYALGVDIGGTKVATVLIDESGRILNRSEVESIPTDKEKMFGQVIKCIEMVLEDSSVQMEEVNGIGVGIPGKVDRENGIAIYQNNLPWKNFPIVSRLQDYFSIKNIVIDNDVYMATYAEWKVANLNTEDTFVYLTVSTGISCSIIHRGSFLRGNGFAGEIGLFPVLSKTNANGMESLEKVASGPAIQKRVEKLFTNQSLTTKDLFRKIPKMTMRMQLC